MVNSLNFGSLLDSGFVPAEVERKNSVIHFLSLLNLFFEKNIR